MTWLFPSLRGYRPAWLRTDLVAGLTVWAVLIPEALAYASIAGVSPVVGLYAAPGALILYAAPGSSRALESVPSLDVSAARMLGALAGDLRRAGVDLRLAAALGQARDVLAKTDSGPEVHPTIEDAIGPS